jgi:glycosyltransferase involved in cell wall biosynthesis
LKTVKLKKPQAVKVVDIELSQPVPPLAGLEGYEAVWLLVKLHGLPVGDVKIPNFLPSLEPAFLIEEIVTELGWQILLHLLEDNLLSRSGFGAAALNLEPENAGDARPSWGQIQNMLTNLNYSGEPPCIGWRRSKAIWPVTVSVCTRNGADRLGACLNALEKLDYPDYEILIVDNAPSDNAVWQLLEQRGASKYRYVVEPRPGVSWARNRAIQEARGAILAFTDDDARPDAFWLLSLVAALQRPATSLVVGRAYPRELETKAQVHCAYYWGHDKGFIRQEYSLRVPNFPKNPFNTNTYGGAYNLAAWREVFLKSGGFDVTLGRGSPSGSASDTDLFYRLIVKHEAIFYDPTALVRISYPKEFQYLIKHDNLGASGYFAYLTKRFSQEPANRLTILRVGVKGFFSWYWRRLLEGLPLWQIPLIALRLRKPTPEQRILISSMLGALSGPRNYRRAVKRAKELTES